MNTQATGNVLDNASVPPGAMALVTGFTVAGSTKVMSPGSSPVTLISPTTGAPMGTIAIQSTGAYTFVPALDYVGPAPAITLNLLSTDGQKAISSLTLDVLPGELKSKSSHVCMDKHLWCKHKAG